MVYGFEVATAGIGHDGEIDGPAEGWTTWFGHFNHAWYQRLVIIKWDRRAELMNRVVTSCW